jgi:hypothetical protein
MLIDQSQVTPESPEFVRNRVAMQDRYMEDVWEKFEGMVRAIVPLYENEVRSVEMLKRTAGSLFSRQPAVSG